MASLLFAGGDAEAGLAFGGDGSFFGSSFGFGRAFGREPAAQVEGASASAGDGEHRLGCSPAGEVVSFRLLFSSAAGDGVAFRLCFSSAAGGGLAFRLLFS